MALVPLEIERFNTQGYLVVRELLTAEEVEALRQRADAIALEGLAETLEAMPAGSGTTAWSGSAWWNPRVTVEPVVDRGEKVAASPALGVRKLSRLAGRDDVMRRHATHPKIVEILADLIGPDIKLYVDQLFMKPPRVGSRQGYHQDSASWREIVPANLVTCWAALDDATRENGCLWVIPGSHREGLLDGERAREIERQALEGSLESEVPVELRAGDCSFHHSLLLHSSHANRSDRRRRGYATHYMSARSQYRGAGPKPEFLLVRGQEFLGCV